MHRMCSSSFPPYSEAYLAIPSSFWEFSRDWSCTNEHVVEISTRNLLLEGEGWEYQKTIQISFAFCLWDCTKSPALTLKCTSACVPFWSKVLCCAPLSFLLLKRWKYTAWSLASWDHELHDLQIGGAGEQLLYRGTGLKYLIIWDISCLLHFPMYAAVFGWRTDSACCQISRLCPFLVLLLLPVSCLGSLCPSFCTGNQSRPDCFSTMTLLRQRLHEKIQEVSSQVRLVLLFKRDGKGSNT